MPLNRQELLVRVIDREGRVRDREALVQHLLERAADRMTVFARRDEHMRRQDGMARCKFPRVQIVHLFHVLAMRHRHADLGRRHPFRRAFEEHADGFALEIEP